MTIFAKALLGTAAGAMALSTVSPAMARDHGGIDAGDVIAGALVIGGIAAIAAAASRDNDYDRDYGRAGYRYDDRSGYGYGYDHGYGDSRYYDRGYRQNPRQAVEQCVRAAERNAARYSYGSPDVTDIRSVRETRYGFEVRGRIAVNERGWRDGDSRYGRGWDGDYRGWRNDLRGYDSGSFTCRTDRGRVVDLDYSGLRGL